MDRYDVADFVDILVRVYTIIILIYIVVNFLFAFGLRPGYYRWLDTVLDFLRDVSEPYLRLFRRFIPPLGPIDISPIVAIIVLQFVGSTVIADWTIRGNT